MALTMDGRALHLRPGHISEIMTENPLSISAEATLKEAAALLMDREISGAPVINDAGHPVGVITQSDLVRTIREIPHYKPGLATGWYGPEHMATSSGEQLDDSFQVEDVDRTTVSEVMTPRVISVTPGDSIEHAVEMMITNKVHRLFVVDHSGTLLGVVSTLDILGALKRT